MPCNHHEGPLDSFSKDRGEDDLMRRLYTFSLE